MSDVSAAADAAIPTTEAADAPAQDTAPKTLADAAKGSASTPKTPGPAPWTKDLEGLGLDPETLVKVDQYMRDKVQPHTTQLEQKASEYDKLFGQFTTNDGNALAPGDAAKMAAELLNELASDPENAVREIMQLMQLDPQKFAQVQDAMEQQAEETIDAPEDNPELTWVQQQMQAQQEAEQDRLWAEHLQQLAEEHGGKFADKLYTLTMASVGPEAETAMQWYQDAYDQIAEIIRSEMAPKENAPATLGEGNVTPPEEVTYGSIRDAVRGFAADMKASRG